MSKTKKVANAATVSVRPPSGYTARTRILDGYWDPDISPGIHLIPDEVRIFDGRQEPAKPSVLILGELVDPIEARAKGDGGEIVTLPAGSYIALNGKPGMRDVLECRGVPTFIMPAGEKDVGRPSKMKLYDVLTPPDSPRVPLHLVDRRRKSRRAQCWAVPTVNAAIDPEE